MSLGAQVSVVNDTASPWLREMQLRVSPHRVAAEVGPRCTRMVQRNFRGLGKNKMGWPSTQFWGRAAEATNWQEGFGFVMLSVNQIGVRQRLMGGTIRPVKAGALTIPASAEAYGKTAREFGDLQLKMLVDPASGKMRAALVQRAGTVTGTKKMKGKAKVKDGTIEQGANVKITSQATGLVALFWLAKSVTQEANPGVMPSDGDFQASFDKSIEALLKFPTKAV